LIKKQVALAVSRGLISNIFLFLDKHNFGKHDRVKDERTKHTVC